MLLHKPGALPGAKALAQARAAGVLTRTHDAFWAEARRQLGDAAGTRALIEVLLAHRYLDAAALIDGMERTLQVGCVDAAVVVIEARRAIREPGVVIPIGVLARYDRPLPTVAQYDALLAVAR